MYTDWRSSLTLAAQPCWPFNGLYYVVVGVLCILCMSAECSARNAGEVRCFYKLTGFVLFCCLGLLPILSVNCRPSIRR